jgi:hypothetical protein
MSMAKLRSISLPRGVCKRLRQSHRTGRDSMPQLAHMLQLRVELYAYKISASVRESQQPHQRVQANGASTRSGNITHHRLALSGGRFRRIRSSECLR